MRAIMLMFDSLNRGFLPPYGLPASARVIAPNFMRLQQRATMFTKSYVGSMPCMPARRELHTGRLNFLHRSWGPIEPFDDSMPEILSRSGVYTHMISDHQHYWEDGGCTYHHRYNTWEIVRGQEGDRWKGRVEDPHKPEHLGQLWRQDIVNRLYIDTEDKQPQTQVINLGLEFLETNLNTDNWFLHLETFDPHEPFYSMPQYKALYPHSYEGPHFDWPNYAPVTESPDAVQHLRYEYAALLSMCDSSLGRVLDFMDENNMWRDTLLIVNTDHGFLLGEHDWWAKMCQPMYEEIAHTPLFISDPRCSASGEKRDALVQTIDLAPTLLDYFEQAIPEDMQGKPLRKTVSNNTPVRSALLFGQHGGQVNVTDGRYVYMRASVEGNTPLYNYTLMPTHMRQRFSVEEMRTMTLATPFSFTKGCPLMRIETQSVRMEDRMKMLSPPRFIENEYIMKKYAETTRNLLFDLQTDPDQLSPIEDLAVEARMIQLMKQLMQENDAPLEQYVRLGLL